MWNRPVHLASLIALALSVALANIGARAADPQPYTVAIDTTGNSDLDTALQATSLLVTLRGKARAGGFAVVDRAKEDIDRLTITLHSFGYYKATIAVTIADKDVADPDLLQTLDAVPSGQSVAVHVKIDKGPRYTIRYLEVDGIEDAEAKLNILSGQPIVAANILAAGARLLTALQEEGYALATVDPPIAYADDDAHVVDILFKATPGPRVQIGHIAITGLKDVNEGVVRDALTVQTGDRYQPTKIEEARQSVLSLGVFSGVGVHAAGTLDDNGQMPLTFEATERPAHAVSLTASYSTDLGASVGGTWSHRNLFGNAEQLNLTALGTGLGGSSTGTLGYTLTAQFVKPMFLARNQTLEFDVGGVKQSLIAYDQTVESVAAYLRRKFSTLWSGSVGLVAEHDQVAQEGTSNTYELVKLPLTVNYDSTGTTGLLQDPLRGVRAAFNVIPSEALNHSSTFLTLQASGSAYIDASDWVGNKPGRSVIAVRGLVASILGASQFDLPPDQRLYVGGSGTVRGYEYQSIGPLFPSGNPIGATSADSASIEFRQRIGQDWGAAAFVDAGQASETRTPFAGAPFVGVGAGVRYYTSIGPIRADIAIPLSKPVHGDAFEIYIGLGQSF